MQSGKEWTHKKISTIFWRNDSCETEYRGLHKSVLLTWWWKNL